MSNIIFMLTHGVSDDDSSSSSCNPMNAFYIFGCLYLMIICCFQIRVERNMAIGEFKFRNLLKGCTTIQSSFYHQSNDNILVHLTGIAETKNLLEDNQFGLVLENLVRLERKVEMFQWVQIFHDEELTPSYQQQWSDQKHDIQKGKYQNDMAKWVVEGKLWINPDVTIGVYKLSKSLKRDAISHRFVPLNELQIRAVTQNISLAVHNYLSIKGQYIYFAQRPSGKTNGDLRVSFPYVSCGPKTVISQLIGFTFTPWIVNYQNDEVRGDKVAIQEKMINRNDIDLAFEQEQQQLPKESALLNEDLSKISEDLKIIDWLIDGTYSSEQAGIVQFRQINDITGKSRAVQMQRCTNFIFQFFGIFFFVHPKSDLEKCIPLMGSFLNETSIFLIFGVDLLLTLIISSFMISIIWGCYNPIKALSHFAVSAVSSVVFYFILVAKN